jgi:hypothetical protein
MCSAAENHRVGPSVAHGLVYCRVGWGAVADGMGAYPDGCQCQWGRHPAGVRRWYHDTTGRPLGDPGRTLSVLKKLTFMIKFRSNIRKYKLSITFKLLSLQM